MQTETRDSQALGLLETVLRELPESCESEDGCIDTTAMLTRLAKCSPNTITENDCQDLHMLCRQIAVPKKVLRAYRSDDRKTTQGEPLPTVYWPLLISVLLMYAEQGSEGNPRDRGLAYKCLNAALQALDMAEGLENVPHLAELRARAERITENVFNENFV